MEVDAGGFARERMAAAKHGMTLLLSRAVDPFMGTFDTPGEAILAGEEAGPTYSKALLDFIAGQGAEVQPAHVFKENEAGPETVLIMAGLPNNVMVDAQFTTANMIEAIAEVFRVMLYGAIDAAKEDLDNDEKVIVRFRTAPEFMSKMDFEKSRIVAMGRLRGAVVCEKEPRANYLLGTVAGQPSPFTIAYELPLAEMVYGDTRFRWKDRRAPDCTALIQLVGGTA